MSRKITLIAALMGTTALWPVAIVQAEEATHVGTVSATGVVGTDAGGGLITEEDAPKQRSSVTTDFIATQAPTSNPIQLLRLMPGANVNSRDAFGVQQSDITVRGMFSTEIGTTVEGVPLNDSGSFAIYPSEWIDSENLSQITLTLGSPDLELAVRHSTGGSINIYMNDPTKEMGVTGGQSVGSHATFRTYARADTGEFDSDGAGTWRAFLSTSYYTTSHFTGPGDDEREHVDFKAVHEWGEGNRIAPVLIVNRGILDKYWGPSLSLWKSEGYQSADLPAVAPKTTSGAAPNTATYYYPLQVNPFIDVIASMPSTFRVSDTVTYDFTPYFWYGIGAGGSGYYLGSSNTIYYGTTKIVEPFTSALTVGGTNKIYYMPSITETYRPGIVNKLTWQLDNHKLVAGYWLEYATQHQWEPLGNVDAQGNPLDPWGMSNLVLMPNGSKYTAYDETCITWINTVFVGDTIGLFDNRLSVDLTLKQSMVSRDAVNHELSAPNPALWPSNEIKQFRAETLPSAAARYKINDENTVFTNFTTNFRVPNTFPTLFGSMNNPTSAAVYDLPTPNMKDERSYTMEVGWRYQDKLLDSALTAFGYEFHDRQWTINVPNANSSGYFTDDVNIGTTHAAGVDGELGFHPVEFWRPYISGEYLYTRLQDNIPTYGQLISNKFFPTCFPPPASRCPAVPRPNSGSGSLTTILHCSPMWWENTSASSSRPS